jgi:ferritin
VTLDKETKYFSKNTLLAVELRSFFAIFATCDIPNKSNYSKQHEFMLSQKLHDALNAQVNAELWSAYLYLSMSLDAESKGLKGVANWFYVQFCEEQAHARIFMNYINSRDAKVELKTIDEVPTTWDSALDMFKETLNHERKVTALINNLAFIANEDRDFASINRINWFIDEQVEEEENARDMIQALEAVEGNKYGMYMLDKELATRTYTEPSPLQTGAE